MGHVRILARSKLKDSDFAVYEDIRKAQMHKVKAVKKKGLKAAFSKAQPDRLFIKRQIYPCKPTVFLGLLSFPSYII